MTETIEPNLNVSQLENKKADQLLKQLVFVLCLIPLLWLIGRIVVDDLGANPIEEITRHLGDWALRFLLITLAITPIRSLIRWSALGRLRRMLGLFSFFYVVLHLLSYIGLDQFFYWTGIWEDILKRVYITLGMLAVLMLAPLAATSTDAIVRRLGGRSWRRLHRLVYPAAILAVVHFFMMIKADYTEPAAYALILGGLISTRVYKKYF